MSSPEKMHFPSFMLNICGELYIPTDGSTDRKGAAVVISHPMTGVKEQTATDYARWVAKSGFYALTFDAGYQGESTGEPRGLEDPHQRVEDNKAAVTYLTTLKGKVDPGRIGVLGICASGFSLILKCFLSDYNLFTGGYTSYAAQSDSHVRALATVSAACVGRMTRNGGLHKENSKENSEAIAGALQAAGQWRTSEANGPHAEAPRMFSLDLAEMPEDADSFFKDAAAYYWV